MVARYNSNEWIETKLRNLRVPEFCIALHLARLQLIKDIRKQKAIDKAKKLAELEAKRNYRPPVTRIGKRKKREEEANA